MKKAIACLLALPLALAACGAQGADSAQSQPATETEQTSRSTRFDTSNHRRCFFLLHHPHRVIHVIKGSRKGVRQGMDWLHVLKRKLVESASQLVLNHPLNEGRLLSRKLHHRG